MKQCLLLIQMKKLLEKDLFNDKALFVYISSISMKPIELVKGKVMNKQINYKDYYIPLNKHSFILKECLQGFSWIVLRNIFVTSMYVDGINIGNPKDEKHPTLFQNFRGFYHVPPGNHEITGEFKAEKVNRKGSFKFQAKKDDAVVKSYNSMKASWSDEDAETELRYKAMAKAGHGMMGCLQCWPQAMVFVFGAQSIKFDTHEISSKSSNNGVVGINPGSHNLLIDNKKLSLECPRDSVQVTTIKDGNPLVLTAEEGAKLLIENKESVILHSLAELN